MKTWIAGLWIGALPLIACATATPGAEPHEMGAAQHEAAAREEERAAAKHAEQYDPAASAARTQCGSSTGPRKGSAGFNDVCWTSMTNPTETHLRAAEKHKKWAADHRAGSAALREAEARACGGVADDDRDISPFEHVEDISSLTPLGGADGPALAKASGSTAEGVAITFRAVPGMSAEWLQRVVDCHLARNASLGHEVPEMPDCPLVPRGVSATVSKAGDGLLVSIKASDPKAADEILARAQRLMASKPKS